MNRLIADAALVHGAGFIEIDSVLYPSEISRHQTERGIELLEDGYVDRLIVCGRGPNGNDAYDATEASLMRDYSLSLGVSDSEIIVEDTSTTTLGNWINTVPLAAENGVERIVGITHPSHLVRAKICGQFVSSKSDLTLAQYQVISLTLRPSSVLREIAQVAALKIFLRGQDTTDLQEIPANYEAFKERLGLNNIKQRRYTAGSARSRV